MKKIMKDSRRGKISGSRLDQVALCPGSYEAQKGKAQETSPLATSGTKIHDGLERDDFSKLTDDERDLAERAAELREELISGFFADEPMLKIVSEDPELFHHRETRLRAFDGKFSGQFDGMVIDGKRALLYDYKTGYLEPIDATANLQMRGYAVLLSENYPEITEITVAIIQPRIRPEISLAVYDEKDLDVAVREVEAILDRAYQPNANRHPGPIQCKYCLAKADCPEAAALTESLAVIKPAEITADRLPDLLTACAAAKKIISAIESRAKEILTQDESGIPGYTLKAGGKMTKIVNPQKLFNRLNEKHAVLPHEFVSVCEVGKGKLKELVKTASGLKGHALTVELNTLLDGVVKETEKAASITKCK